MVAVSSPATTRALILGCGAVGTRLGARLVARGMTVTAVRRDPAGLPISFDGRCADLVSGEGLEALPWEADLVFYCAAADDFSDESYRRTYVEGVAQTVRRVERASTASGRPPRLIVFTSSTAVWGRTDGAWVNEETAPDAIEFSGRRLLQAEQILFSTTLPTCVVRLAGIYGKGPGRLVESVRDSSATRLDGPEHYGNRIHVDDCAGVLEHLTTLTDARGVWIGADDDPADLRELADWLAHRLGVPPPRRITPSATPDGAYGARRARTNKRCSNHKLRASGYSLLYPTFREGYAALLARAAPPAPTAGP